MKEKKRKRKKPRKREDKKLQCLEINEKNFRDRDSGLYV